MEKQNKILNFFNALGLSLIFLSSSCNYSSVEESEQIAAKENYSSLSYLKMISCLLILNCLK